MGGGDPGGRAQVLRIRAGPDRPLVPDEFPEARKPASLAVASHCTLHYALAPPPAVTIDLL